MAKVTVTLLAVQPTKKLQLKAGRTFLKCMLRTQVVVMAQSSFFGSIFQTLRIMERWLKFKRLKLEDINGLRMKSVLALRYQTKIASFGRKSWKLWVIFLKNALVGRRNTARKWCLMRDLRTDRLWSKKQFWIFAQRYLHVFS